MLLDKLRNVSTTAVSVIGKRIFRIGGVWVVALVPIKTKCFLAIKENKPIRQAGLRLVRRPHAREFQERACRSATVVGANKLNVFEIFSIVVARDYDHIVRFAG